MNDVLEQARATIKARQEAELEAAANELIAVERERRVQAEKERIAAEQRSAELIAQANAAEERRQARHVALETIYAGLEQTVAGLIMAANLSDPEFKWPEVSLALVNSLYRDQRVLEKLVLTGRFKPDHSLQIPPIYTLEYP